MDKSLLDTLEERIDTKANTVFTFHRFLEEFQEKENDFLKLEGNQLIIITNFGQITCDLLLTDSKDQSTAELIANQVLEARDNNFKDLPLDTPIISNCKTILLKNVVITPFSNPSAAFRYAVLTLFTDQIVGVTVGKQEK